MEFCPITSIEVTLDKEDKEALQKAQTLIADLINKMRSTSLQTVECQRFDDIYNIGLDELVHTSFVLRTLEDIDIIKM